MQLIDLRPKNEFLVHKSTILIYSVYISSEALNLNSEIEKEMQDFEENKR